MKKLTKKYVIENTSISGKATPWATLESCGFQMSEELEHRDDKFFDNMIKWGWIQDRGRMVLTQLGYETLKTR